MYKVVFRTQNVHVENIFLSITFPFHSAVFCGSMFLIAGAALVGCKTFVCHACSSECMP